MSYRITTGRTIGGRESSYTTTVPTLKVAQAWVAAFLGLESEEPMISDTEPSTFTTPYGATVKVQPLQASD